MKTALLKSIEKNMQVLKMNFKDNLWYKSVPSAPGWYFIETKNGVTIMMIYDPVEAESKK